jgi:hypothetical protein
MRFEGLTKTQTIARMPSHWALWIWPFQTQVRQLMEPIW